MCGPRVVGLSDELQLCKGLRQLVVGVCRANARHPPLAVELVKRNPLAFDESDISQVYHVDFRALAGIFDREATDNSIAGLCLYHPRVDELGRKVMNHLAIPEAHYQLVKRIPQFDTFAHSLLRALYLVEPTPAKEVETI
jgi:hypothetical protein